MSTQKTGTNDIYRYLNNGKLPKEPEESDLDKYYRNAQARLDQGKKVATEKANAAFDTAQKYLPIQNKMNGLSGLGASESASIDVYNKYLSQLGQIEQNHASDSTDLLEYYRTEKKAVRNEALAREKQEAAEKQAKVDAIYAQYMDLIGKGVYNSFDELDGYVAAAKAAGVDDSQLGVMERVVTSLKNNPTEIDNMQAIADSMAAMKGRSGSANTGLNIGDGLTVVNGWNTSFGKGDNFRIHGNQIATNGYAVESRGQVPDTETDVLNIANKVENGKIFAYNQKIYYKLNGKVYEIGPRGGKEISDDYTALYNYFYSAQ